MPKRDKTASRSFNMTKASAGSKRGKARAAQSIDILFLSSLFFISCLLPSMLATQTMARDQRQQAWVNGHPSYRLAETETRPREAVEGDRDRFGDLPARRFDD